MGENIKYTLKELKKKLTEKEKKFCHEYVVDWNGSRAARAAGYSKNSAKEIAHATLTKIHIKQYIDFVKEDYEMLCGISKTKQLQEYIKIAYSSIAFLHNTWIELTAFENLNEEQKACIESTESKTEVTQSGKTVEYIKVKLYSKLTALERIDKLMGYNAADKHDLSSKDGTMTPIKGITFDKE